MYSKAVLFIHKKAELIRPEPKVNSLEFIWGPFLFALKAIGLYHYKANCKWWRNGWKFYSCLSLLLAFGTLICHLVLSSSCISGKDCYPADQLEGVVDMVWFTDVFGYAVSLFLASHQPFRLRAFHQKWLELLQVRSLYRVQCKVRRQAMMITGFICAIIFPTFVEIAIYKSSKGRSVYFIAVNMFLQCIEFFSLGFFVLVSTTLISIIAHANSQFLKLIRNPTRSPHRNWEMCRSTYVLIIDLINIADDVLSFPIGMSILSSLAQLTFLSFTYVLYVEGGISKMINSIDSAFWDVILVASLSIVLWKASAVNNEVRLAS